MNHSFDVEYAKKYGVNCAIILNNLIFWSQKNSVNNVNIFDGSVWVYNSVRVWKELFPYMSENTIRNALKKLEQEGIIKSGNYSKLSYDQTKWYSIIDKSICQNNKIHLLKLTNGIVNNDKPIPIINTDINTDIYRRSNYNERVEGEKLEIFPPPDDDSNFKIINNEAKEVADYLLAKILSVNPAFKNNNTSWTKDIDLVMRIDKRSKASLIKCIDWIYNTKEGSFWIPNILSGKKLREKFDTMNLQAMRNNTSSDAIMEALFPKEFK